MMPIEATENLVGSVKKVESTTVSLFDENGDSVEHLESESTCSFDEANNLIEVSHRHANQNWLKTINKYDSRKSLVEQFSFENETLIYRAGFTYNDRDQMVESSFYDYKQDEESVHRPIYTEAGLRIDEITYEPFSTVGKNVIRQTSFLIAPEVRISFSLNNVYREKKVSGVDGQILEITFFNYLRLPTGKISVIYEGGEKPVKIIRYGDDTSFQAGGANWFSKLFFRIMTKFSKFLLTLFTSVKLAVRKDFKHALNCLIFGAPIDETVIAYDDQNRICEIKYRSTFTDAGSKTTFKYDENGNKTEMSAFSGDETLYHTENHEYRYDSQNNWVTRKTFYRLADSRNWYLERTILTRREIEYY